MAAMIALAWTANGAVATQQKTPAKTAAAKKKSAPAKKGATTTKKGTTTSTRKPGTATKTASSRGKKAPAKRVTWRNRQMSPSPDRYREIQGALAAKGFLSPEDATGTWNQTSSDALKKVPGGAESGIQRQDQLALSDRSGPRPETRSFACGSQAPADSPRPVTGKPYNI